MSFHDRCVHEKYTNNASAFVLGKFGGPGPRTNLKILVSVMGNACTHEEDTGRFLTPRTRARVDPAPLLLLRHPKGDGSSPRPMTPEERQYLFERKRLQRLNQQAYLRSVTSESTSASQREVLESLMEEAGDAVPHSAAGVLGSWGAGTVPSPLAAVSPPPEGLAQKSSKELSPSQLHSPTRADRVAEERGRSWIDVLRHDKANVNDDDPSLLRDVSSALTAIVPEPSTAQAETDALQPSLSPAPSKPTVTFAQERISSPMRPPSIAGLGLPSPTGDLACPVTLGTAGGGPRVAGLTAR